MTDQVQLPVEHSWSSDQWDWPLQHHDGVVKVINDAEKFEVGLEVPYFTPKEIDVKVMGHDLVVHCRHEERSDEYGQVMREVHRSYHIPLDVDMASLKSQLGVNGILAITAQKKK